MGNTKRHEHDSRGRISSKCILKVDLQTTLTQLEFFFFMMHFKALNSHDNLLVANFSKCILGGSWLEASNPMSPYLFDLSLKIFLRLLHQDTSDSTFHYHPKCIVLQIDFLVYANSLLFLFLLEGIYHLWASWWTVWSNLAIW